MLAPGVGFLGVTLASCASGQASATWGAYRRDGGAALDVRTWAARAQVDDLVIDALMGATLFMAMGGRFRSILPSDVRHVVRMLYTLCAQQLASSLTRLRRCHTVQGALARESLPAAGSAYATDVQRAELRLLFRRHGCHHCGTRFGPVIADHQPPNKTVYGSTAAAVAAAAAQKVADDNPVVTFGIRMMYPKIFARLFAPPKIKQRFFPQCESCSQLQSDAMRRSVKKLVAHFGGVQPFAYAGVLVGLRQYTGPDSSASTAAPAKGKANNKSGSTLEKWLEDAKRALR